MSPFNLHSGAGGIIPAASKLERPNSNLRSLYIILLMKGGHSSALKLSKDQPDQPTIYQAAVFNHEFRCVDRDQTMIDVVAEVYLSRGCH